MHYCWTGVSACPLALTPRPVGVLTARSCDGAVGEEYAFLEVVRGCVRRSKADSCFWTHPPKCDQICGSCQEPTLAAETSALGINIVMS